MTGIQYPVDIKDIGKYKRQNNIGDNVYGCEDKKSFPLLITTTVVARHHVNLSYINAGERSHYVLAKDLKRLVPSKRFDDDGSHESSLYNMLLKSAYLTKGKLS